MRRIFVALSITAFLVFSVHLFSAVKNECCPGHFQILKAYQESMQTLVDKVKGENVEDFERRYHDKEALTYLDLLKSALDDIDGHYKEMNNTDDETAVAKTLERVEKYAKQLRSMKGAEAKKLVESIDVSL